MYLLQTGFGEKPEQARMAVQLAKDPMFWRAVLHHNDFVDFDDLWGLDVPWHEPPNSAGNGWSGVCRIELKLPAGGQTGVYVKRQQNYRSRSMLHPLTGETTLAREYRNLQLFQACGIKTQQPVFFSQRRINGNTQAILLTEALDGYASLDVLLERWAKEGSSHSAERVLMLEALAEAVGHMHRQFIRHNCLYSKHILIKSVNMARLDIRFIDLEKAKRSPFRLMAVIRDLDQLKRNSRALTGDDWRFFCEHYFKEWRYPALARWTLRRIFQRGKRRIQKKNKRSKLLC